MITKSIKQKAIEYRKQGYSYNLISQKLDIAKSTLSHWLREIPFNPNREVIERVRDARLKSAKFKNGQRLDNIIAMRLEAIKELGNITKRDLWMMGIGLYLGEGSKAYEYIRIANSDPQVIKISMKWFREICGLKNNNFRLNLHLYPDSNIKKSINYWSLITGLSKNQFGKIQIDRRINKSKNKKKLLPNGTLHIIVKSNGNKKLGVSLHRKIMGWIEAVENKI